MKRIILFLMVLSFAMSEAQKKVALYWDVSLSMKNADLQFQLNSLNDYFVQNPDAEVNLVVFSNEIIQKDNILVKGGDWNQLKAILANSIYDGGTDYSLIFKEAAEEYLLFTDGAENISKLKPTYDGPVRIFTPAQETKKLKSIAKISEGSIKSNPNKGAGSKTTRQIDYSKLQGIVSSISGALEEVNIQNRTQKNGTTSDANGRFSIPVELGDEIVFSYVGKESVFFKVGDERDITVYLPEKGEQIDEVVVNARVEEEQLVNVGDRSVDKKKLGYSTESVGGDAVSDQDINLIGAVKGQFTNLQINNPVYDKVDISQFVGRHNNMTLLSNQYGLIVLDGVPLAQSSSATTGGSLARHNDIINPDMIVEITYLKGLAATNRYGSQGANGVLLINTKATAKLASDGSPAAPKIDGITPTFSGSVESMSKLSKEPYISRFLESKSIDEAFNVYLEEREKRIDQPDFYLDVAEYFGNWGNTIIIKRILSNVYELGFEDPEVLRALAYKQQQFNLHEAAKITFERIKKLRPNESQSYRDLALANLLVKDYKEAYKLYSNMDKGIRVGQADFSQIRKSILLETRNLVNRHGGTLQNTTIDDKFRRAATYRARIVVEWNTSDCDFELNIINPKGRYFTWSHVIAENPDRVNAENQLGFRMEEFYLTDEDKGDWKFNLKYIGRNGQSSKPIYFKVTTYKNYGMPNQTETIEVYRVSDKNVEKEMTKVSL